MIPLLEIRDLSVSFKTPNGVIEAVDHVSLTINRGESLALVGESGSGKSAIALSIPQLLPYPAAFHTSGSIKLDGEELIAAPEKKLCNIRGDRISMIFQEPNTSLNPLHTIEKQVGEVILIHNTFARTRTRVLDLLQLVGLDNVESRLSAYPHQLSGGQRQRVMIAMALANDPELLIADEPTTALDVTIQAQILELLNDLQKRLGMAMLLITHDLGIVKKMTNRIAVMMQGKIVETGSVNKVMNAPEHAYTRHLIESKPRGDPVPLVHNASAVLEVRDLKVRFPIHKGILRRTRNYINAVNGVTLQVCSGQTIGVVGESGSGKTTLGQAVLRLHKSNGTIVFLGQGIQAKNSKTLRPLRKYMQLVFQDPYSALSPRMSVGDIIGEGLKIHNPEFTEADRHHIISSTLEEVGLEPAMQNRLIHEFSGGQRQRISIARVLVLNPKFIVLDEPTSALDMSVQSQIIDLLRKVQSKHKIAYMFISHDLKVIRALSHYIVVMRDGYIVEQGETSEIFNTPKHEYTRSLIAAAFDLEKLRKTQLKAGLPDSGE